MVDQNVFTGNLGRDPEIRYTTGGKAVASFSIGNTPRRQNRQTGEWEDGKTVWHRVEVWDTLAENVAASIKKGNHVMVIGNLVQEEYTDKQGQQKESWKVRADNVALSLRNQRVQNVERASSGVSASRGGGSSAPAVSSVPEDDDTPF